MRQFNVVVLGGTAFSSNRLFTLLTILLSLTAGGVGKSALTGTRA